jgi:hypothetical protein
MDGVLQMIIEMLAILFMIVAMVCVVNSRHDKSNIEYEEYRRELEETGSE